MPSRNELNARARGVGLDPATIANDSKLEQRVLYLEKNSTAITGTAGSQTLTSDAVAQSDGDQVLIGDITYTFKTTLSGVKATAVLNAAGVFSDGETIQIGNITYTMRTALTSGGKPFEVLIGASAAASLDNIKVAINKGTGEGTEYGTGTYAHPLVTATTNTNTDQTVESRQFGTASNLIPVSEQGANCSWGSTTLGSGAATVPYQVLLGANPAEMLDNLKSAINDTGTAGTHYSLGTAAHPQVNATTNTDTTQLVVTNDFSVTNASIATTDPVDTGGHMSWGSTTLASGASKVVAVAGAGTKDTNAGIAGDKNV